MMDRRMKPSDDDCPICQGAKWVCEVYPTAPWGIKGGCSCGALGVPCEFCNPSEGSDDRPDMPPGFTRGPDLR